MRLWTVHPRYLDAKGLVALWREGLLAKAVLEGKTRGYANHPQLVRFRAQGDPQAFICEYLREVLIEAGTRGYNFNADKLPAQRMDIEPAEEARGQLHYEWQHLLNKLARRDKKLFLELSTVQEPAPHPLFRIVPGGIQHWEKIMARNIDPKEFHLPSQTILEQIDTRTVAIVMKRKSRIIMADGRKILEKARKIKQAQPQIIVIVKTSAPVCSKTLQFLEKEKIRVVAAE